MTRAKPIDDVRAIVALAKLIARKRFREELRKQGTPLHAVKLMAAQNRMLEEQGTEIYAEARREWERIKPSFAPANPRRTRKARKGDVGSSCTVEANSV